MKWDKTGRWYGVIGAPNMTTYGERKANGDPLAPRLSGYPESTVTGIPSGGHRERREGSTCAEETPHLDTPRR